MTETVAAIVSDLARALTQRQQRLATSESCTGGGIAAGCTDLAGSSDWFDCGFVTYSNAAKTRMLSVDASVIAGHGAVSEAVVRAMAAGALSHSDATWAVAVSGIAGPGGGSVDKPVGTVWLAWAGPDGVTTECACFDGDRAAVRAATVQHALQVMLRRLNACAVG